MPRKPEKAERLSDIYIMDFCQLRLKFSVDFVHLIVHLSSPSQAKALSRKTNGLSIDTLSQDGTVFRVKVQDVNNTKQLWDVFESVRKGPNCKVLVEKFEISQDLFLPKGHSPNKAILANALTTIIQHVTAVEPDNARWTHSRKSKPYGGTVEEVSARFLEGWSLAIGNKDAGPIYQAAYVKTTDNGGESLPENQHRARFEVRFFFDNPIGLNEFERFNIAGAVEQHFKLWKTEPTRQQRGRASLKAKRTEKRLSPEFDDKQRKYLKRHTSQMLPADVPAVFNQDFW